MNTVRRVLDSVRGDSANHVLVLQLVLTGLFVAEILEDWLRATLLVIVVSMGLSMVYRAFSPTARRHAIDED